MTCGCTRCGRYQISRHATYSLVGGIRSAEDAYQTIRLSASLVQVLTALVYGGPGLVKERPDGSPVRLYPNILRDRGHPRIYVECQGRT